MVANLAPMPIPLGADRTASASESLFHAYDLQDANCNVMALLSAGGEPMEQYTWEPYGMVLTAETLPIPPPLAQQPKPPNRADHQGLFLYRFDLPTAPPIDPDPTALGLYYNRSRLVLAPTGVVHDQRPKLHRSFGLS